MADPLDTFAANMRRVREAHGLSQERLAHVAGLNMPRPSAVLTATCRESRSNAPGRGRDRGCPPRGHVPGHGSELSRR
jgi:hypothetical protein